MQNSDLATLGILIVEDEPLLRKQMMACLEKQGADVTGAETLQRAQKLLENLGFDFAFLDVNLPDGRGTDLLKEKNFPANTGVIVMTAEGAVSGAVEAMRLGAIDYLVKPFDLAELPLVIARARRAKQSARLDEHRRSDESRAGGGFFFGTHLASLEKQLQKILATDRRLGQDLPPVLIEGETGTGKTTIARWLHREGPRAGEPLVEVNCSALPEGLAESELFGHERGAFTDARTARMGLFEAANGGTLFLDEAPSLSLPLQAKVLTAIEDRKIRRVGGNKETRVDVRVIAATNRELKSLVAQGQFREDLFHRLDLFRLCIPPLRGRGPDILALAEMLLDQLSRKHRVSKKSIHPLGQENLLSYPWPGNVRELAHELERAIVFEEADALKFEHLCRPGELTLEVKADSNDWFNERFVFPAEGFSLDEAILRVVRQALKQSDDNVSAAARLLGVSRDYVRYRLAGQKSE
ncbi:MAG: sigma-54-dependent Fis family transcriptional regulator [Chloroflexi bacterium]|nr:sigma-54-dependent Fis family transcriptional regulator [Chloroflexota bacterium]